MPASTGRRKGSAPLLPILLSLALIAAAFGAVAEESPEDSTDGGGSTWVIDDHHTCRNTTLVVDRDITIKSNGTLELVGCTLRMDSPAYNDTAIWKGQGLVIRVEKGGALLLRPSGGQGSGIVRRDSRYGYTIQILGLMNSSGASDAWNEISGLEGHMAEAFLAGGLEVGPSGTANLSYTRLTSNEGPAPFLAGGSLHGHNVVAMAGSGMASVKGATFELHDARIDGRYEALRLSVSDVRLEDVSLSAARTALHLVRSDATLENVSLAGAQGVVLKSSKLTVRDGRFRYDTYGVLHKFDPDMASLHDAAIQVHNSTFRPRSTEGGSTGIVSSRAPLTVTDSAIKNNNRSGIDVFDAQVEVRGTTFRSNGDPAIFLTNPQSYMISGNDLTTSTTADSVRVTRLTTVRVIDGLTGQPLPNATVTVRGFSGETDPTGRVRTAWIVPLTEDARPAIDQAEVEVGFGDRHHAEKIAWDADEVRIRLPADTVSPGNRGPLTLPLPSVLHLIAVLGWVSLVVRRCSRF